MNIEDLDLAEVFGKRTLFAQRDLKPSDFHGRIRRSLAQLRPCRHKVYALIRLFAVWRHVVHIWWLRLKWRRMNVSPWRESPVHGAFDLSYANYLVVPRSILESMPHEWQQDFIALMDELHERLKGWEPDRGYVVQVRGHHGRFVGDRFSQYRHPDLALMASVRVAPVARGLAWLPRCSCR